MQKHTSSVLVALAQWLVQSSKNVELVMSVMQRWVYQLNNQGIRYRSPGASSRGFSVHMRYLTRASVAPHHVHYFNPAMGNGVLA